MATKETKEWLLRAKYVDQEINGLIQERSRALDLALSTTGTIQEDKVQTSHVNSSEQKILKVIEYSEMIDNRIDELIDVKDEIMTAIAKVNDSVLRPLLLYRYINFMTWEQIANEMYYSYKHVVHCLHPKALSEIEKVIECNSEPVL